MLSSVLRASRSSCVGRSKVISRTLIAQPPSRLVTPRPLPTTIQPNSEDAEKNRSYMREVIDEVRALREKAREGGGKQVLEKWKSRGKGKLGVRER